MIEEEEKQEQAVEELEDPFGGNAVFAGCLCVLVVVSIFILVLAGWRLL